MKKQNKTSKCWPKRKNGVKGGYLLTKSSRSRSTVNIKGKSSRKTQKSRTKKSSYKKHK